MLEKILYWLIFGFFLALFPIILSLVLLYLQNQSIDFKTLVCHGELYIMITSFVAPLLGDWIGVEVDNKLYRIFRLLLIGAFLYLLLFSVAFYAAIITGNSLFQIDRVSDNSSRMFIGCVIIILASIILKEQIKKLKGVKGDDAD